MLPFITFGNKVKELKLAYDPYAVDNMVTHIARKRIGKAGTADLGARVHITKPDLLRKNNRLSISSQQLLNFCYKVLLFPPQFVFQDSEALLDIF
jgi:hypothetical protein